MSNPIDRLSETGVHRLAEHLQPAADRNGNAGAKTAADGRTPDLLDLTGKAKELKSMERELAREPAFDAERVDALRQSLADGSYRVNPERIANKLLMLEQQLP